MKYFVSFLTTLKISRYLFRTLVLLLWLLIALLSVFYVFNALRQQESNIRIAFNLNYDQAQRYIQQASDALKELKYFTENHLSNVNKIKNSNNLNNNNLNSNLNNHLSQMVTSSLVPLTDNASCTVLTQNWRTPLQSMVSSLHNWRDNFFSFYNINYLLLLDIDNLCMIDFGPPENALRREHLVNALKERTSKHRNTPEERGNNLFWIRASNRPDTGYFYGFTPVWLANRPRTMLGSEQTIRRENLLVQGGLSADITLLDNNGHVLLSFNEQKKPLPIDTRWLSARSWFGRSKGFKYILLKRSLPPTDLSIIYSLPLTVALARIKMLVINVLLLNLLLAGFLFALARLFEKRLFIPAENDARRLEENEQFNRKIVAYAPVGICILRVIDGSNILSNELAHNYLNMLTHEDKQRLNQVVHSQQIHLLDVLTSNNTHLQISFVHSRYRNENVAICVLVDVSERVKMEKSLQEIAQAAEQANQAKSMFLATVSHELRTPLYGIIGNLELLRSKALPKGAERLVGTMSNSSSLLLKIISDILDFSKIESEQLKIEPVEFSPEEITSHIVANYLPLVVRKQLTLYCFIAPDVPASLCGDAMRLQQVISNLLSNAIKFTDLGCIILRVRCEADYLLFQVRDTGTGIAAKDLLLLFEPFFQTGNKNMQHGFQGTGLGLAICEKLITMMDGDIAVETEQGIGSEFSVRIPLYQAQAATTAITPVPPCRCWLAVRNVALAHYLQQLLHYHSIRVQRLHTTAAAPESQQLPDKHIQSHQPDPVTADYSQPEQNVLISDSFNPLPWAGELQIHFSGTHIGAPVQSADGVWLHSTATPHELIALLNRIYSNCNSTATTIASPTVDTPSGYGDLHILIVDDHPINRQLLTDQLSLLGYNTVTANDGLDALDVLKNHNVDIILTDVNMPDMDGYSLTRHLRQQGCTLPVIGVTANALAEEKQRCLDAGMDDCLSKPVALSLVQQTLACYANKVRQSRKKSQ